MTLNYCVQSKEEDTVTRNEFKLLESKISKLEETCQNKIKEYEMAKFDEKYQNQINDLKKDNDNLRRENIELKRGLAAIDAKIDVLSGTKEQYKTDMVSAISEDEHTTEVNSSLYQSSQFPKQRMYNYM